MRNRLTPDTIAVVALAMLLAGCDLYRGVAGNIYEKMTIFSLIAFVALAVLLIPFVSGSADSKALARYRELVRSVPALPAVAADFTSHPVYVWDAQRSFRKLFFGEDGSLAVSGIVTSNGQDPKTRPAGTWSLGSTGKLQLNFTTAKGAREYAQITPTGYQLPTLMRLNNGYGEAWFLGGRSLALTQISCFGYSESQPAAAGFTRDLVAGVTVYWASYPCTVLNRSEEIAPNPELAYGMITFHPDGAVSKSINNAIDGAPDYRPSFSGTWSIDERHGVLNYSVGLYTSEVKLLLLSPGQRSLLIGTTAGTEQWFLDPERGHLDLASYLALGIHLDAAQSILFLPHSSAS